MNMLSSHHDILYHSTDRTSRNLDTFLSQPSASLSTTGSSLQHVSPWILPPIPSFAELGIRFDKSRTSSPNATATDSPAPLTSRHSFSDLHDQIEHQHYPRLAGTTTEFTTAPHSVGSNGIHDHMKEHDPQWGPPQPCQERNAPVAQDMVPNLESSIFDDLQSDSNETFIVWNIPLLNKPTQTSTDTTGSPMPSTPLTQSSLLLPPRTPTSSTAHSYQASTSCTGSTADPVSGRGPQGHVASKPSSAEGPSQYPKQDLEKGPGTRHDAAPSTRVSEAKHSPAKDRLIMAATAEKLVQKLTSEIDYTFLTDFFLIYRLFITPAALLKLFMLRFEWALLDNTPERQIVRIRTFVALRHWLLNYFGYDFMGSRPLRQTLSAFLQSLAKHPLVMTSPRDQRIAKELRRYTQSLKKLHYRTKAQEKLEQQGRRHGSSPRRSPMKRRSAKNREWSPEAISAASLHGTGTASSQRSSRISESARRRSTHSTSGTEELQVEFRSSDQSDEGDTTDESSNDDASDLSSGSETESNVDDLSFEERPSEDDITDLDDCDIQNEDVDSDADNGGDERDHGFLNDSQDPHTSVPHPAAVSPTFGSLRSQRLTHSVISSVRSRTAARGVIPNFKLEDQPNRRTRHPVSYRQSHQGSLGEQPITRPKGHSRPLSSADPSMPAVVQGPPLSTRSSLRSIEPYMNPPPRAVGSSEKRKTWSKYMSATVGHLSKMKRVFSSSAGKSHRHSHSSSSIPSLGGGSRRGTASSAAQSRPSRCWQGNRSDPEGEKISHYLLGSCTGMSVLLSTSDVRRLSIDHRYAAERGQQRDEAGSGWSSDDDYSQYEMTRRGSEHMSAPIDYMPDIQSHQLDALHLQQDLQTCETSWQQRPYTPYRSGSFTALDVNIEQNPDASAGSRRNTTVGSVEGGAKDKPVLAKATVPADPVTRPAHVLRRTPRLDQNHRESWVTFSSTGSSVFAPALNGAHPTPSRILQEPGVDNADESVERLFSFQQQHGRHLLAHSSDLGRDVPSRRATPARRHSANLQCLDGWRTLSLSGEHDQSLKALAQSLETGTLSTCGESCRIDTAPFALISARPNMGARSLSHPEKSCSKSDTEMNFLSVKNAPMPRPDTVSQALGRCGHWTRSGHGCCQQGSERQNSSTSGITTPSVATQTHPRQPNHHGHHSSQFLRRATDPQLFHSLRPLVVSPRKPHPPSIVLRYRSEMIAQQLCLIERDLLSKVEWFELLDAGWTKKTAPEAVSDLMVSSDRSEAVADPRARSQEGQTSNPARPPPAATRHSSSRVKRSQRPEDSPGIKRLVERFNLTCQWVTSEIVCTQDLELRVKVVEKFIRIAQTCYNHSNFSSLMQLMSGLQAHSVSRLSQTWARVRSQEMNVMHDLVEFTSPFHNWKHLREAMRCIADEWGGSSSGAGKEPGTDDTKAKSTLARARKAATSRNGHVIFNRASRAGHKKILSAHSDPAKSRSASNVTQEPDLVADAGNNTRKQRGCIPFLGLYLSDLVFNSELPSFVDPRRGASAPEAQELKALPPRRPLINIHKHRTTATIIKRVLTFRTIASRYPFQHEAEVQAQLMSIQSLDPADISHLSGLCEERT